MQTFRFGAPSFIVTALALGILGDLLLREGPPGVNLAIYIVAILALVVYKLSRGTVAVAQPARVALAAAVAFAVLFVLRDVSPVSLLVLGVIAVSIVLIAAARIGRDPRVAHLWDYVLDALNFFVSSVRLPVVVATQIPGPIRFTDRIELRTTYAVLRGILIAAPVVVVFGALLISADAIFEQLVLSIFDFDVERIVTHAAVIAVCAWVAAAVLWQCLEGSAGNPIPRGDGTRAIRWGAIELNVAFGIVTLLFATFLAVQVRYLFGGHERVLSEAGLTYAEYARQGFFELAAVAGLSLALLVNCSRVVETASAAGKQIYKLIAGCFILAVFAILASAMHRMYLYVDAYGLTRLRVYTAAFMVWMVVVFAWLYVNALRETMNRFAWGVVLSGYAATFLLLVLNPDAFIARINLSRAIEGKGFDLDYFRMLSADSIPPLVRARDDFSSAERTDVDAFLNEARERLDSRDVRTWNLGVSRARSALRPPDAPISGQRP